MKDNPPLDHYFFNENDYSYWKSSVMVDGSFMPITKNEEDEEISKPLFE